MAPVVVAFLEQVRAATYRSASEGTLRLPVTLVLDEVANVAPLPDLPAMVSEGGGQRFLSRHSRGGTNYKTFENEQVTALSLRVSVITC